jgi:dihydroxyacid dehydratase/phosphogluconate dehydratase
MRASLVSREVIADSIELVARGLPARSIAAGDCRSARPSVIAATCAITYVCGAVDTRILESKPRMG